MPKDIRRNYCCLSGVGCIACRIGIRTVGGFVAFGCRPVDRNDLDIRVAADRLLALRDNAVFYKPPERVGYR